MTQTILPTVAIIDRVKNERVEYPAGVPVAVADDQAAAYLAQGLARPAPDADPDPDPDPDPQGEGVSAQPPAKPASKTRAK